MTNASMPVSYFKKEAKKMFRAVEANEPEALARVRLVLHDTNEITLTRVQHVIAIEYGFTKWTKLIKASPAELQEAISKKGAITSAKLPERKGTPLGSFLRGPGILPTPPHLEQLADMFDGMTYGEQRRYLDEDARVNFGM